MALLQFCMREGAMGLAAWSGSRPAGAACERPVRLVMAHLRAAWFGPSERAEGAISGAPKPSPSLEPPQPGPFARSAVAPLGPDCRHA